LKRKSKRRTKTVLLSLLMIIAVIAVCAAGCNYVESIWNTKVTGSLSRSVLDYRPVIEQYADEENIGGFTGVIQAMMMQESKGQGLDPMQASECPYNTRYEQVPNGIEDPDYSIAVGVAYFAECLRSAGCTSPEQTEALALAIQGYNFGNGYIAWAKRNYGGYTEENAREFSASMQDKLGWNSYGDPTYASKVLTYYQNALEQNNS
jgi:hypothetical protein